MTVLTMPCWFYDKKDLRRSPSIMDGLDIERENRYRREGARFIINVGTKMGLRYDTMATGVVYFHRFYMFHSFKTFPRYIAACCCLFLAGKVEETPKKCKDIIRVAKTFLTDAQFAQFGDDPKEEVMTLERILLQTIKFDLQVDHPYGYLLKYAKCLKGDQTKLQNMVQMAWTFINDSLCTTLCLQWEPEVIAIALMYLAGKLSKFEVVDWNGRTSKHSFWWDIYVEGMSLDLLEDICHQVLDLYSTPVPNTPRDSPPATPPTKSSIRKVNPVPHTASPVSAPVSPVPPPKAKEIPVGQPIPRLEPGELKRKAAKMTSRKDSTEGKGSRSTPGPSKAKKRRVSTSSPTCSTSESEANNADASVPSTSNQSSSTTETTYQAGQYSAAPTIDTLKPAVTQTPSTSMQNQYLQAYNRPITFLAPDSAMTYFTEGQSSAPLPAAYIQNASYMHSQAQPALASSSSQAQSLSNIQPPRPVSAPYPEVYSSQATPTTQGPPPQYHPQPQQVRNTTPISQYPPPPAQPPTNILLPNVTLPPPNPPTNLSQPPPLPMPSAMVPPPSRATLPPGMPNPVPMPPVVLPPPSQIAPRGHYIPRPEHDAYPHDNRISRERAPSSRLSGPIHRPPRYYRDGPPQDYNSRGHYEQDRPSHFRNRGEMEYDRDRVHDDRYPEYRDEYNCGPPAGGYGHEYENNMPPFRRYGHERGPPPPSPMLKNPPLMDTPTGIPPVRITGSMYGPGLE